MEPVEKSIRLIFCLFRPTPSAYGSFQARYRIGAVAATYSTITVMWDQNQVCDLHHSSRQCWILNPLSEARDGTRNLMVPSQIHFHCTMKGTPIFSLFLMVLIFFNFIIVILQCSVNFCYTAKWPSISFFLFGHAWGMQEFPGQGSDPHHSSYLSQSGDNTGPLTHWTTRELPPLTISTILKRYLKNMYLPPQSQLTKEEGQIQDPQGPKEV